MPPDRRRIANWISFRFAPGRPLRQPISRTLPVSEAVNSRYPSPEMICCCETAPASAHPSQPEIFRSTLPLDVTFTRLLQTTLCLWAGTAALQVLAGPGPGATGPPEATPAPSAGAVPPGAVPPGALPELWLGGENPPPDSNPEPPPEDPPPPEAVPEPPWVEVAVVGGGVPGSWGGDGSVGTAAVARGVKVKSADWV